MDTINKDKRRFCETNLQNKYRDCWLLSLKYSKILMNNIDSNDLYNVCCSIKGEYFQELRYNNFNKKIDSNKNYCQVWDTMLKSVLNKKNKNNPKSAVRLLHQTNVQRVSIFQ